MNPQYENNYGPDDEYQQILEELSVNERCFFVYFDPQGFLVSQYKSMKPYILVYKNDDEREVSSLIDQFATQNNFLQYKGRIEWFFYGGFEIRQDWKIKDIKKTLRKDNINGLMVFGKIIQQMSYVDECSIGNIIENQNQFNGKPLEVPFRLPTTNQFILYLKISLKDQIQLIRQRLSTEIKRVFGVNTNSSNIQIYKITDKMQKLAQTKEITNFIPASSVFQQFKIKFKNNLVLKQPPRQNNSIIIIKGQGIKSSKLYYDDIKDKKVIDVLSSLKDGYKWEQHGLKISDVALKPFETFAKIQQYCKNSTQTIKHLAANIIKQEHIFQMESSIIKSKGEVDFQQIIVPEQNNEKHRKICQAKVMDRATKTSHAWFKDNLKNVKPILLYTSQLKVKGSQGCKASIYRLMNAFLREQQFCKVEQKEYEKWEFRFATQLLHQLSKISKTQEKLLWRGVSYPPKHTIGEQVLFRQFNSSSKSQKMAKKFAQKAIYKIKNAKSVYHIKQYSFYQSQDEVLFEPYVTLKIDNITQIYNEVLNKKITQYQAHQVLKKPLPDNKSLFILWVDDKTKEGKNMWQSLAEIQRTTVMIQLLSTQQLQKWLNMNKSIVMDESVQMVMITNMKRVQLGNTVQKAGVYAVDVFKKFKPDSNIFVYIGYIEGAVAKLKQHNYHLSDKLIVDNNQNRLREFLKTIGLK